MPVTYTQNHKHPQVIAILSPQCFFFFFFLFMSSSTIILLVIGFGNKKWDSTLSLLSASRWDWQGSVADFCGYCLWRLLLLVDSWGGLLTDPSPHPLLSSPFTPEMTTCISPALRNLWWVPMSCKIDWNSLGIDEILPQSCANCHFNRPPTSFCFEKMIL